jgi:hypothetical protein
MATLYVTAALITFWCVGSLIVVDDIFDAIVNIIEKVRGVGKEEE